MHMLAILASLCDSMIFQTMGQFTYLVAFDSGGTTVNKLITVSRKSALLARAEALFGVSSCAVEYYSKTYQEYIRPVVPEEIPDGGKVRLVSLPLILDASTISSASTVPILTIQPTDVDLPRSPLLLSHVGQSPT